MSAGLLFCQRVRVGLQVRSDEVRAVGVGVNLLWLDLPPMMVQEIDERVAHDASLDVNDDQVFLLAGAHLNGTINVLGFYERYVLQEAIHYITPDSDAED